MQQQQQTPVELIEISDDQIAVEVEKQKPQLSAEHAAQLGRIGTERGEQNFQKN